MKSVFDIHSLPVQMILSFVGIVMLTAAAVGIPALLLIRQQLDRQAWTQVDQGRRASLVLYGAKLNEMEEISILTAQRPTLGELLIQKNWGALESYLETLKTGAGLDFIAVCEVNNNSIISKQPALPIDPCISWKSDGFQILTSETSPQVWLTATNPVPVEGAEQWQVLVGQKLDEDFVTQMRNQTGMENTIKIGEQPVVTSFTGGSEKFSNPSSVDVNSDANGDAMYTTFVFYGQPYFSAEAPLAPNDIHLEVALSVADIQTTQNRMVSIMAGGIFAVAVMGSIVGIFLARRISQPLVVLAETAEDFRKGDLSSSVSVESHVREVTQVAQALESARIDLQQTLTNLEREKAWVNHLIESIVEGIMTLDDEGKITYFSEGAVQITGWNREDILGRPSDEIFVLPETDASFSQRIPITGTRSKLLVELADGHKATLAFTKARLAPAEVGDAQIVLVFRDVSEGEIIHRILGDFLANIAHEFRTPLSAAAASTELLLDQAADLSTAELYELLNSLHLGIRGLQTLVDNLLESARIEAGRFWVSPQLTDLGKIVSEAVQVMRPLLDKYNQQLVVELPADIPIVYADERRIVQVLVNLLSNASKYGPTEAEITITVSADNGWIRLQVADLGPGIPQDQQSLVFRRYMYPGKLDESAQMGAGLGLSVVKAVVEAHGGQVGVEDRPGGGSIFWIMLPKGAEE